MNIINKLQNFNYSFFGGSPLQNVFEFQNQLLTGVNDYEFNNETLRIAVNLWFGNRAEAITQYGDISLWNVSKVTDMRQLFSQRSDFNENISGWDVRNVIDMKDMFYKASAFNQPLNEWNVSKVANMFGMFDSAHSFNQTLDKWDTSNVTIMAWMFDGASAFNQPLQEWNVGKVTNMSKMFYGASAFNQPLNEWNVSKVTNMFGMFDSAHSFNQTLDKWDTSNVTSMNKMFNDATSFNSDIRHWDISNVTTMEDMFDGATAFIQRFPNANNPESIFFELLTNQTIRTAVDLLMNDKEEAIIQYGDISLWNVSKVTDMDSLFSNATAFNADIGQWNVSAVTNMVLMFSNASTFNADISKWNVSNVTSMIRMFDEASAFNQPIGKWNVENVTVMPDMFYEASAFNQPLNEWNVSKVTNMFGMFDSAHSFNQTLDKWDTSNVTSMNKMFNDATSFNSDIRHWDISNVTTMENMFDGATAFIERFTNANNPRSIFFAPHIDETIKTAIAQWFNNKEEAIRQYGDISLWNVSKVTDMRQLFLQRSDFNENISGWDVRNVTNMAWMFDGAIAFNQPLQEWNVGKVTNMGWMFDGASAFNQPLQEWNVGKVTNMFSMFSHARAFNQPLKEWDVRNVTNMEYMFAYSYSFNDSDIRHWDISNVTNMEDMFLDATAFIERFPNANNDPRSIFISSEINTPIIQRNLMSQFDYTVDETCTLTSDKPTVGDYVKVSNIVTNDPSDIDEKQHIIYNKTIQGIYISENVIRILDENFKKTDQQIYPNPKNKAVYKLINKYDYLKNEHIRYINSKLKINEKETIVKFPEDWAIHTGEKIKIGFNDSIPNYIDFIKYFINQSEVQDGETMYTLPLFLFTFESQQGLDYGGLFNSFLSNFVKSISSNTKPQNNFLASSEEGLLTFNKTFAHYGIIDDIITTDKIKIYINENVFNFHNQFDDNNNINRSLYSFFASSFLARIITLEPHHITKDYISSHLFIPDLKLDPYILLSMKNYSKNLIRYKKDSSFNHYNELIEYFKEKKFIIKPNEETIKTINNNSSIIKEISILFPSDIYTIVQLDQIYSKIPEKSILRNSLSFKILQLHKIETEEDWDAKWEKESYAYKLQEIIAELVDDTFYDIDDLTLLKIDFKNKDIWIMLLLRYEFENLLDGTGINLAFFIHGFFSTYYSISDKVQSIRRELLSDVLFNRGMTINYPINIEEKLYGQYIDDPINNFELDELNVLFSGPEEINKKDLKEAITINISNLDYDPELPLLVEYYKNMIDNLIDDSDQDILRSMLEYITGFSSLIIGKEIKFDIINGVEKYQTINGWHDTYDGTESHTCFNQVKVDYRLFENIDDLNKLQIIVDDLEQKLELIVDEFVKYLKKFVDNAKTAESTHTEKLKIKKDIEDNFEKDLNYIVDYLKKGRDGSKVKNFVPDLKDIVDYIKERSSTPEDTSIDIENYIKNDIKTYTNGIIIKINDIEIKKWTIKNNIRNTLFNEQWTTEGNPSFKLVGGAYEIINSLSNFNF